MPSLPIRSVRVHAVSESDAAGRITARWMVVSDGDGEPMRFTLPQVPTRSECRMWPKDGRPILALPVPKTINLEAGSSA